MAPHASRLLGASDKTGADGNRIQLIDVTPEIFAAHVTFRSTFAASPTTRWFELINHEALEEVHVRVSQSGDAIHAIQFQSNLRCSGWYGSNDGEIQKLVAPTGSDIFMLHGMCRYGECKNIGAYFVPLALCLPPPNACVEVGESAIIGEERIDQASDDYFEFPTEVVRAIVFQFPKYLNRIFSLSPTEYERCLATIETPLGNSDYLLVFAPNERITSVRAVADGKRVSSIQLETTHRTSEWFGQAPSKDATIFTQSIDDKPWATDIGGFRGMQDELSIKSLAAILYEETTQ